MDRFVCCVLFILYFNSVKGSLQAAIAITPSYPRYCSYSGQIDALKWYKGEIGLSSDDATCPTISREMSSGMTHSTLIYTSVDSTMPGKYKCNREEGTSPTQESTIDVRVISITTINAKFESGTDAVLQCQTNESVDVIGWMKDKTFVKDLKPAGNTRYVEHGNGTLVIQNSTLDDIAVYYCIVQIQNVTDQQWRLPVMLYTQLEVLVPKNSTTVLLRESVDITCMVLGKPPPSITWLKDGTELKRGERYLYNVSELDSNQDRPNVSLHIASVNWEDAGNYTCLASRTTVPSDNAYNTIEIIVQDTMDDEFVFKKDALLRCRANDTNSTYTWLKNGTNVSELNSLSKTKFVEHNNGDLQIIHPTRADAGEYVCRYVAQNNTEVEKNITLFARPYVLPFKANVTLTEEDRLELQCRVLGYPQPTVTWFKDDIEINPDNSSNYNLSEAWGLSNARLVIESVKIDDGGEYKCQANSDHYPNSPADKLVLVRVRGSFAPLWPLLGILAQVALLTVLFVSDKRRKRKEMAEDGSTTSSVRVQPETASSLRHRGRRLKTEQRETSDAITKL